jgi:hypothetical protein
MSMEKISDLVSFMKASVEFKDDMQTYASSVRDQSLIKDQSTFIAGMVLSSVTKSLINPNDPTNTPEQKEAIELDNLLGSVDDLNEMKRTVKLLDESFSNKHKRIYQMLNSLEKNSTLTDEEFKDCISNRDKDFNDIVNTFVEALISIRQPDADPNDPLNTVLALTLYAMQTIRQSLYSHGVKNGPDIKTLEALIQME